MEKDFLKSNIYAASPYSPRKLIASTPLAVKKDFDQDLSDPEGTETDTTSICAISLPLADEGPTGASKIVKPNEVKLIRKGILQKYLNPPGSPLPPLIKAEKPTKLIIPSHLRIIDEVRPTDEGSEDL